MKNNLSIYTYLGISLLAIILLIWSCSEGMMFASDKESSDVGQSGSMARFTIAKDHLYTVDRQSLRVFNITDAKEPTYKNKTSIGFDIETIFNLDDMLFIGAETAMYIYKINDPENPYYLSRYSHIYSCDPVVANQTNAFVTLSTSSTCGRWANELHILNIEDPTSIKEIAVHQLQNPKGLGLKGNILYLCDDGYLKVYDVSDLYEINLLQSINNKGFDVIPMQNSLLTIGDDGFYQYSYNNDYTLNFLSKIEVLK